jgi:hypothetical protein
MRKTSNTGLSGEPMGLFSKRNNTATTKAEPQGQLQIPDELAQRAALAYGSQQFTSAAEAYAQAVDKLHTMYAVGNCQFRQPSPDDLPILEGLVNSVGAAIAMGSAAAVRQSAESSLHYLGDLERTLSARGQDTQMFRQAIENLSFELRKA